MSQPIWINCGRVLNIFKRMWKYRWIGLERVLESLGWWGAVVVFFMLPDRFREASARSMWIPESILKPLMSGLAVQPNVEQQVGMLSRTLISRGMSKLVRMADLDLKNQSKAQQDATIDQVQPACQFKARGGTTCTLGLPR